MEVNMNKELEIEEKILSYLNHKLEEKNLVKIFKNDFIISGIIFHKDESITYWSKAYKDNNIKQFSNAYYSEEEIILRQVIKDDKVKIRKLKLNN